MGLVMHWYDFVCVGIVGVSVVGAIVVLIRNEGRRIKARDRINEGGMMAERSYESLLVPTLEEPVEGFVSSMSLWISCWRCVHPALLAIYRFLAFIIMLLLLIWDIEDWTLGIYAYYTEWTFTLVIIYFGLATIISAKGCSQLAKKDNTRDQDVRANFLKMDPEQGAHVTERSGKNLDGGLVKLKNHQELEEQKKRAGFWGYAMQIIFQTCAGAVMMTDIVFWLVIVPFLSSERFALNLLMGSMHTVNALLLLIDASLNSMNFPWFRGAYFVLWTALYVIFQWIIHACGMTWWPYPFLELSTPWAPL
ncbi:hypothetical protein KI387_005856, partial [Taxus chinensis]